MVQFLLAWGPRNVSKVVGNEAGKGKRGVKKVALKLEKDEPKDFGKKLWKGVGNNWGRFINAIEGARTELVDGGAARLIAVALLYPLDTCKARLQFTSAQSGRAVGAVLKATPKWYGGVITALSGQLGYGIVTFGMFEVMRQVLKEKFGGWGERRRTIVAACVGDLVGSLWLVPMESLKLKLQTGVYKNALTAVSTITKTGSWRHLYQGFWGQVIRDMPFRALQILTYDYARRYYLDKVAKKSELSKGDAIAVGAATGAVVGAVTTPLDVIRTRVMSQRIGAGTVYANWVKCLSGTVRAEGASALFRGMVPRTVYMGASVALFSVGFEVSRNILKRNKLLWHTAKAGGDRVAGFEGNHIFGVNGGSANGHAVHSLSFSGLRVPIPFADKKRNEAL